ncbi:hypothetical protein PIB30_052353 [Stylosanthes scabra]|uniref:Uncharacterized protein n=1 Tax=Stylosanthes scabra TaxID=79078 RepID=A0ABU6RI59_9FABA|nr:hypothetical protein [Stylosanthes scabra]
MEVESVNALMAQLNAMNKKLVKLKVSTVGAQLASQPSCGICGGSYENHNCNLVQDDQFSVKQAGEITPISIVEVIKGNGTIVIFRITVSSNLLSKGSNLSHNRPTLHLNLLQNNSNYLEAALEKLTIHTNTFIEETRVNFKNQGEAIKILEV